MSKATFEVLSLPDANGDYYLRPSRILGAFVVNPKSPPALGKEAEAAAAALAREWEQDKATKAKLVTAQRKVTRDAQA